MMKIEKLAVGQLQTNCYFLINQKQECLILDPGDDADFIIDKIQEGKLKPLAMLATHGHFDHVMAAFELQLAFAIPFYLHPKDEFLLDRMSQTAQFFLGNIQVPPKVQKVNFLQVGKFEISDFAFEIIHTPGHTPGSVSFYFSSFMSSSNRHSDLSELSLSGIYKNKIASSHHVETRNDTGVIFVGDVIFAGGGVGRTDFSYCNAKDLNKSIEKILKLPEKTTIYSGHREESRVEGEKEYFK
ncbi:MBL fold metallo-hydrolase [Candidatus Beckwithbacteria bacterium]|nr:MBL fold metallo-hydrolase [Candidatus Beckwithbacteria bacterium]